MLLFSGLHSICPAQTPANTVIQNQSTATYHWSGHDYGIASNSVLNIVAPQYGLLITPDGTIAKPGLTALGDPGRSIYLPYILTNTGNITDSFDLELKFLQGNFLPGKRAIYLDVNGNGRVDAGESEITRVANVPPGAKINLLLCISIPTDAKYGEYVFHDLRGKSVGDPTKTDIDNVNRIELVLDAVLKISKSPNVVSVAPGSEIEFTLDVINAGSAPAKAETVTVDGVPRQGILVSDKLQNAPDGIGYVPGTLSAAPAQHLMIFKRDGSTQWEQLSVSQQQAFAAEIVEIGVLFLGSGDVLTPGQQARVMFNMSVAGNHPAGTIYNISRVDYRNRNYEPRNDEATNTVQVTVQSRVDGLLIGPYQQPDAVGNTFGVMDNNGDASIDPGLPSTPPNPYGIQVAGNTVYFLNTVRNDANATDIINLTIDDLTNLPDIWRPLARIMAVSGIEQRQLGNGAAFLHPETGATLFKPSNVSTLFDTNGDGIPDTGPLAPGQTYTFAVRVMIPINAVDPNATIGTNGRNATRGPGGTTSGYADNDGRGYRVTIRATSTLDPSRWNLTSNIIKKVMGLGNFWDPFIKDHEADEQIYVGSKIRYINTFGNKGPGTVYNTIIRDELNECLVNITNITNGPVKKLTGSSGITVTAAGSYDPLTHAVVWHIFEIPPGFTGQIGFTAEVAAGTKDGTEIPNVFTIVSDQTNTVYTSNPVYDAVGGEKILTISKTVSNDKVEIGDPVRYELQVANAGTETIRDATVEDYLPNGFRYLKKSARIDKDKVEPDISNDGSTLLWELGDLAPGQKLTISYVCIVTPDARLGQNTNSVMASGKLPKGSLIYSRDAIDVEVEVGIFHNDSVIFGKVFIDQNDDRMQNFAEPGIAGVRLILENGAYVITDREGKYHFSGIKPGMHVLRLDESTLPPGVKAEIIDSQNIFNPLSRTIELRYGTPHKANFRVCEIEEKPAADQGATTVAAETGAESAQPPAPVDNHLKAFTVQPEQAASKLVIECEQPLAVATEFDAQSGILHVLLPGVTTTDQAKRQPLDDANISSLQCHLDSEQKRAKVQVRLRKRTSGYPEIKHHLTPNGLEVLVGSQVAKDYDPSPETVRKKSGKLILQDEFRPRILTPEDGDAFISTGQIGVTIACFLAGKPTLFVNGEAVPESRIGQRSVDVTTRRMTYLYYGLSLHPGKNSIRLEVLNPGAREPEVDEITVYRANTPSTIKLEVTPQPLMADSLTEPQVRITLLDAQGVPSGHGAVVTVTVDKGDILSPDLRVTEPGHQAQVRDGNALIRLSAASSPETRKIGIIAGDLHQTLDVVFAPHQRNWIVNAIVSGTASDQKRQESERNGGERDDNWKFDDRIAFFAKGALPKDFVLTAAYDSKKPRDDNKIFEQDDPLKYYPVYGDESEQQYEAESRDKLYLKLEREQSYFMYGDFNSKLDKAELTAYQRNMTGAQLHLESKYADVDAFFSRNDQILIKGLEIPGRGVSGYYTLPDKDIIWNSERIVIETRDRWHLDQVVKSESMARYTDYSIDYSTGRILFKKPIPSRDQDNNPVYIVVDYEIDGAKNKNYNTYGGRAELHDEERTMHIGITNIRDESATDDHTIEGIDAAIEVAPGITLKGETAKSRSTDGSSGSAWRLELESTQERSKYRLYHRNIGSEFDNESMSGDRAGMTTTGFEGEFKLGENWLAKDEIYRETDKTAERLRHIAIHDFVFNKDSREFTIGLGYTQEENISDDVDAGEQVRSPFLRLGTAFNLSRDLRLELFHQQAFGDKETDQGTRTTADLSYALNQYIELQAGIERREASNGDTELHLNAGLEVNLNESVSAFNRYKLEDSVNGQRVRSGTGLDLKYNLTPEWRLGGTAEYSKAIMQRGEMSSDDFWALTLSAEYQPEGGGGTAISRFEVRDEKDAETSYLTEVGGTLKLNANHTLFGRNIANYITGKKDSKDSLSLEFLLGWAYRPVDFDKFNLISDFELKYEDETDVADYGRLNRLMLSIEGNYQPVRRLVLEGKYACKAVTASYLDSPLFSDVKALGARVDLNDRFFITAGTRILSQYDIETHTLSYGVSLGANIGKGARIAVGYNFEGFKDKDFARGEHWEKGFFLAFHWKFDESIFGILRRLEGTERQ